ncbi:helix-turn-helix domain-containing protein [Pseudonocardia xishanensis]|uniref:TetR family transcriptional regulator n=1 Tax=Pseudonocardia xishanensis TaxID=630995 RepID=A0ABP8RWI4_9PSEU
MVRWEPGTPERLQAAALELFATRGYEQTTAAEIAQSVGLTERTFFRHFADKREVLFHGQQLFVAGFLEGARATPGDAAPLEVVRAALGSAAGFFGDERRPHSRRRQTVIDANPALQERELHKMVGLADALRDLLRERGVAEPAATLAARVGTLVFEVSFATWIAEGEERSIDTIQAVVFAELVALVQ